MHRLLLYRGIYLYLFLLLFCTNYTLAQLVPTAFEQALDKDNRSAPREYDEQAAQKQGGIKLQQQQQQQGQILSIVATTYLQPRPTSLPAVAANPTRFDDEDDEQDKSEIKLLPAAPHQHQRKRKRDQAANILHILAHLALFRPFLQFLLRLPFHLFHLPLTLYTWSLPLTSYLLSPLLWVLSLIFSPFFLAYRLFQATQPLWTFALLAVCLGAAMGGTAALLGGSGIVPQSWRRGRRKLGGRSAVELFGEEEEEKVEEPEARWERRGPLNLSSGTGRRRRRGVR